MMRKAIFFLGIVLICSCGQEKPPIPKKTMVNILLDVHISDALLSGYHAANLKDSLETRYLSQVLEKWHVSDQEFELAMNHMSSNPDYMTDVLQLTLKEVGEVARELDDQITEEKKVKKAKPVKKLSEQGKGSIYN